uniref:Treslin N-terminal domain-containing protein n=1 Tax=Cyprinus carpio TaxID=7962 RepID=A0A8C2KAU1_CYPCA
MASTNVFFAIDVDYRPEESNSTASAYQNHLKHWILRVLLSLGHKYGLEKVRWGYKFFHSRTVKSATLITRGSDFKELQEKVFSDFEEELIVKFSVEGKTPKSLEKSNKLKPSPARCVQNALKESLLDFQWDRPDLTSPTKVTLRPRRSSRSGRNIPLQDYDMLSIDKNILFVVSECPRSKKELEDYLSIRRDDSRHHRDIHEQVLSKGLRDMLMQRKVVLHWADSGILKVRAVVLKYCRKIRFKSVLQHFPFLSPFLPFVVFFVSFNFFYFSLFFLNVIPKFFFVADGNRQSCSVTLEPVSCRQRILRAPVDVVLRGVLQDRDSICLSCSASESWILQCTDAELGQEAFQPLKQLSTGGCGMLADVSEGGVVCSAVLLVLSSCTAQLTVLQPLVTQEDQLLPTDLVFLDTTEDLSSDLPDVVSSVLNVMYDIMEDEDLSDQVKSSFVPDWANQDLKQRSCSRRNVLVEGWFPLSDQSGISCHLMESMSLLHAAPEEEECSDTQQEITSSLSELYQSSTAGSSGNLRSKKRGTQCTPVRQKMKTMSRSLQMLNFARLNVKSQKTQGDSSSAGSAKGAEKGGKRCSGDRTKPGPLYFNSEEELITHLGLTYQKALENRSVSVPSKVQDMLSVVKAFIKTNTDVSFLGLVHKHLLKSCQFIRQLYGNSSDEESKIRECQLQAVLRLELCRQPEQQENEEVVEQRVEDVADMLRIISRTKDAVYLSKFMQDEVLFLNSIPKVLADIYHSLGTQLPEALFAALPSDFFSDESMAKDSVSVSPSPFSATQSNASSVGDHLEELRNRSAKKRRQNMLTRHKSMTEAPQALRQIEMPRKSTRLAKPKLCIPVEKPAVEELQPPKQAVQEVTKVRRNLFNQVAASPSKKSKMPRSQSVSAVEGLKKRKRSHMEDEGRHSLLTKKVSETPLHKQVSNRLLHRQRTGIRSGESDVCIIEESPVKPAADLRRSPRIKGLTRRHSSVFYSSQQPRSRNLDRAISSSQLCHSEGKEGFNVSSVRSPVRLLFGATQSPARLRHITASSSEDQGSKELSLFESQNKTPQKLRSDTIGSAVGCRTPQSPRSPFQTVLNYSPSAKSLVEKQVIPAITTPSQSYGFRQTPDRRQREAEARLGYSSGTPKISTPRTRQSPACGKMSTSQPLTYEVEMEMQASGLPKLKLRRTDSFNACDAPSSATKGVASHLVHRNMSNVKAPQVDSPLAQCSRHPGCISPSLCSRGTPAKGTPGKGVQTYICQSITPTHYPANSQSPLASPLTPSPQSRGWSTPENLNSWPRKKRARIETCGSKEQVIKGVPLLEKTAVLEDPELSDVFHIQEVEELKESVSTPVSQRKLGLRSSQVMDHQCSPEGMDWTETVVQECDARDPTKSEQFAWMGRKVDTPKVKKPVSASGIFALTQSPLLYKKSAVSSEAAQRNGSRSELDISPLCQPRRRRTRSRTYSRKKLLD